MSQGPLLYITPLQTTRIHPKTTGWQISGANGAASLLGINPDTLRSSMLKLGISRTS